MASLTTFVDNFANFDLWPDSYETYSIVGGRGRLASSSAFSGLLAHETWSMPDGAVFRFRVYPDLTPGATTAVTAMRILKAVPDGTDIGIMFDANDGNLWFENRTDYWDDNRTSLTYSGTTHAFWGFRRSGSNFLFETAPEDSEGVPGTWTTRRTVTIPTWLSSATDVRPLFETNRDSGTSYAELDYVNTPPPVTVNKGAFFLFF